MAKKQQKKPEERKQKGARLEQRGYDEYAYPSSPKKEDVDVCKLRVDSGEHCFCKERCSCRSCQERKKNRGEELCDKDMLKAEGGCELGCYQCSNCNPCW